MFVSTNYLSLKTTKFKLYRNQTRNEIVVLVCWVNINIIYTKLIKYKPSLEVYSCVKMDDYDFEIRFRTPTPAHCIISILPKINNFY